MAIAFLGRPVLGLLAVCASAWVFGEALLDRLGFDTGQEGDRALATTLGLGILSQALFVIGILRGFYPSLLLTLLVLGHIACWKTWRRLCRDIEVKEIRRSILVAALLSPLLVIALYPETGFDATSYHLPFVDAFLEAHALVFVPELRFPVFPQSAELVFLLAEVLGGSGSAKLMQFLAVLLTAHLLYTWGRRSLSPRVGLWASSLWLGTPLVVWMGSMAYVDASLTLFVTAALSCWQRSRDSGSRWLLLAGFFVGMAAGTKYLGIFFCFVLLVLALRRGIRPALWLTLLIVLAAAPWFLRILFHTGNPIFPFYEPLFGASEWTSAESISPVLSTSSESATWGVGKIMQIGSGLRFLLMVPWNAVFRLEYFHHVAPFSPWLLVLIPAVFLAWSDKRSRWLITLVAVYGLFWLTTIRDLRFLLPVLPPLYLASLSAVDRYWPRRWPAITLALLLLAPGPGYAIYKIYDRGILPTSVAAAEDYLARQVPGYACVRWLNRDQGSDYTLYALGGERLRHYAEGRFLGDRFGPYRYEKLLEVSLDGEALAGLLEELDVHHLLIDSRVLRLPSTTAHASRFRLMETCPDGFLLYELLAY